MFYPIIYKVFLQYIPGSFGRISVLIKGILNILGKVSYKNRSGKGIGINEVHDMKSGSFPPGSTLEIGFDFTLDAQYEFCRINTHTHIYIYNNFQIYIYI